MSIHETAGLSVKIFPNPVSQGATITIDADASVCKVEWFNISGALIKTISANATSCTFTVSGIEKGTYVMKIETEKGISVAKVRVQ